MPESKHINAFVDEKHKMTVLGGLVAVAGSDSEIASVLAHEHAHMLLGHVAKTGTNIFLGRMAGLVAGIAIASAADTSAQGAADIMAAGMGAGGELGSYYFSKSMELEADHLGMFITKEAGYFVTHSSNFIRRMIRLQAQYEASDQGEMLGFLSTHPSDEKRLQNLIGTEQMIEQGAKHPNWKLKK